jgi:hypothetical protein
MCPVNFQVAAHTQEFSKNTSSLYDPDNLVASLYDPDNWVAWHILANLLCPCSQAIPALLLNFLSMGLTLLAVSRQRAGCVYAVVDHQVIRLQ